MLSDMLWVQVPFPQLGEKLPIEKFCNKIFSAILIQMVNNVEVANFLLFLYVSPSG